MLISRLRLMTLVPAVVTTLAVADGSVIDKVYHPYVEPLGWELEWRLIQVKEDPVSGQENSQLHRVALGHAILDKVFAESICSARVQRRTL